MKKLTAILFFTVITAALSCNKGNGTNSTPQQQPTISIADNSLNEGSSGNANFEFTISLSNDYSKAVSVHYSTIDGTA